MPGTPYIITIPAVLQDKPQDIQDAVDREFDPCQWTTYPEHFGLNYFPVRNEDLTVWYEIVLNPNSLIKDGVVITNAEIYPMVKTIIEDLLCRGTFLTKGRGKYKHIHDVVRELGRCCIEDHLIHIQDLAKSEFVDVVPKRLGVIQGGLMFLDREEDLGEGELHGGTVKLFFKSKVHEFTFWVTKDKPDEICADKA